MVKLAVYGGELSSGEIHRPVKTKSGDPPCARADHLGRRSVRDPTWVRISHGSWMPLDKLWTGRIPQAGSDI